MKRELFNKVIDYLKERYGHDPSITKFDDSTVYNFKIVDGQLKRAKALIDGNKALGQRRLGAVRLYNEYITNVEMGAKNDGNYTVFPKDTYLTLRYNHIKDAISCSLFTVGYNLAELKGRIYPTKRSTNVFCYSKHLYYFHMINNIRQIRIFKGNYRTDTACLEPVINILLQRHPKANFDELNLTYKHFIGTKDAAAVVERQLNCKIPSVLRQFPAQDLHKLYTVLGDHNQVNKICQEIKKDPIPDKPGVLYRNLYAYVAKAMKIDSSYLIPDWINDRYVLGEKINLNITSEKRIREEHTRDSRRVRLLGIKKIKTKEIYHRILENFPYDTVELVDDKERLLQEGTEMDHCVVSYADKINSGESAIFSFIVEDARYTMEIKMRVQTVTTNHSGTNTKSEKVFYINQIQSKRNQGCPTSVREPIDKHIALINQIPIEEPATVQHVEDLFF